MRPLALALLAGTALAGTAAGAENPRPGAHDSRLRPVVYDPTNVVEVTATQQHSLLILLSPDEVVDAALPGVGSVKSSGGTSGGAETVFWEIAPYNNMVFIKPQELADTNLQIVTHRTSDGSTRIYQLNLHSRAAGPAGVPDKDLVYGIYYTYPGDVAAAKHAKADKDRADAEKAEARDRLDVDFFYGSRNWRYAALGSAVVCGPDLQVSDNGTMTAFRFPGHTTAASIYAVNPDRTERLVNSTPRDDLVIVHETAPHWRLRAGSEVCDLKNAAYDPVGPDPKTNTTTPEVVRTLRAPTP